MYRALRTEMRPPQMERLPRSFPLSWLYGANPTRAEISRRLRRPSSGSSATSVALVAGPTPGTDFSRSAWPRHVSSEAISRAMAASMRATSLRSHAKCFSTLLRACGSAGRFAAIGFGDGRRLQLPAAGDQGGQFDLFFRGFFRDPRLDLLGEAGQHRAHRCGRSWPAFPCPGEVAHLPRIDDRHLVAGVDQFPGDTSLQSAGGFQHDEADSVRPQPIQQLLVAPCRRTRTRRIAHWAARRHRTNAWRHRFPRTRSNRFWRPAWLCSLSCRCELDRAGRIGSGGCSG